MTTLLWRLVRWLSDRESRPAPVTFVAAERPPTVQPQPPLLSRQERIEALVKERNDGLAACERLPEELRENAMGLVEMDYREKLREALHD